MPPCGASSSAHRSHAPDARVASANTARLAPRGRQRVRRGAGFAARRRARRGVTLPNCLAPSSRRHLAKAARSATSSPMLRPGSSTHLRRIRSPDTGLRVFSACSDPSNLSAPSIWLTPVGGGVRYRGIGQRCRNCDDTLYLLSMQQVRVPGHSTPRKAHTEEAP